MRTCAYIRAKENKMKPSEINILIACEESQEECVAFRARGFNAFSADLQKPRFRKDWHILGDVTPLLKGCTQITTMDGKLHDVKKWHVIIAHPPCTYICKVSAVELWKGGVLNQERLEKMYEAVEFFYKCLNANAQFVAVENPRPMARAGLPKPQAQVSPHWYGNKYSKATYYWLKNLPPLLPGCYNPNPKCFCYYSRGKYKSRTFPEIAEAMSKQWGDFILDELSKTV